jgi:hypothetical protein
VKYHWTTILAEKIAKGGGANFAFRALNVVRSAM